MSQVDEANDPGGRTSPQELARLASSLRSGDPLTQDQLDQLERLLSVAAQREPAMMAQVAFKQEVYSGPLPHPDQLNVYDDLTRTSIVEMAVKQQAHDHAMQTKGLGGAIWKDRLGQIFGFGIAITGLGAAAYISQYSAWAAAIIGTLDLVGMVGVFVIPRAFERQSVEKPTPPPPKRGRTTKRSK